MGLSKLRIVSSEIWSNLLLGPDSRKKCYESSLFTTLRILLFQQENTHAVNKFKDASRVELSRVFQIVPNFLMI